jgi:histidine triad (HIT) family protein
MHDCVFCKIIRGELPAKKVYEDALTLAFWDANPTSPIHILIVPKIHIPTLNDVPEDEALLSHMGLVAKKIARQLKVDQYGYRFFINVNKGGGQVVFHLHAHLISGNDFGQLIIKVAITAAILWRKLISVFSRSNDVK